MQRSGYDVIVIGAGAAGLMCAIEAGKRGRSVLVVESNDAPGKKILISGGGRCNFTNLDAGPDNYISGNPHFCRSALARYTPADFIALVEAHGIAYHEKKLGQLFCDQSARPILDLLLAECASAGVEIMLDCRVEAVQRTTGYELDTTRGDFECESLVVATGGLSIPKMGATDFGYKLAEQFDIAVARTRPGLVPFTFAGEDHDFCAELSGISADAIVSADGQSFRENLLFTHRGLSGPAVLQASSYWMPGQPITVDLLPGASVFDDTDELKNDPRELSGVLTPPLSRRLAQSWSDRYFDRRPLNRTPVRELESMVSRLHAWKLQPAGTEGYARAEVTVGGVDTNELSSKTMESRTTPGLFFIGEVVDVTGWLGGYNFQWAWASGHAAGLYA